MDTVLPTYTTVSILTDFTSSQQESLAEQSSLAGVETAVADLEADSAEEVGLEDMHLDEDEINVRVEHILDEL